MSGILIVTGIALIAITGIISDLIRVKLKEETKKLQYQKEILELELKKEELHIQRLEAESKQYDRLINE